jgi:foldase protein PrsA
VKAMKNNSLVVKSALLATLTIFAAGCGSTSSAAAEINGRKISRDELEKTVTELSEAGQTPVVDGEVDGETVRNILSALVQGAATDQLLKEYGEEITQDDRDSVKAKIAQSTDTSTYTQHLKDLIVELNAGTLALARIKAPDAKKAAEMYEKAPASLGVLCVRHLVVETKETANEALAKFDDGVEFADLAAEFSTEPNANESGGALGGADNACITLAEYQSGFDADFTAGALLAKPGVAYGPVKSSFGYHLIYVRPFTEVSEDVSKLLTKDAGINLLTGFIATSKIKVDSAYGFWNAARGGIVTS